MNKTCWTLLARRLALIAAITVTLLGIYTVVQPTTASAAGTRSPFIGSCNIYAARHLATTLWRDPVSGAQLTANLFGYYDEDHFCGALYAEADLTLPAGYDGEWVCAGLHAGGNGACSALGPGPATGQHTFFIASPDRVADCDGVDIQMQGFFSADVSTPTICG